MWVSRHLLILCSLLLVSTEGTGETSLLTNNPFVRTLEQNKEHYEIGQLKNLGEELEFCGFHGLLDEQKFSVTSKSQGRTFWLSLGEKIEDYLIVDFLPEKRELLVSDGNIYDFLPLRNPRIILNGKNKLSSFSRKASNNGKSENALLIPDKKEMPKMIPHRIEFLKELPPPPSKETI